MKTVKLRLENWNYIREKIEQENGQDRLLISERRKSTLGFTPRFSTFYNDKTYEKQYLVYLDFHDERFYTMFLLKFSDYLIKLY